MVITKRLVLFAPKNMSVNSKNKFYNRWRAHRNNWNRPNCGIDENNKDKVALSRHFSEFHGNVNKPPIHEAYIVTSVEEPNSLSLEFCEKSGITNLTHKLTLKK